MNNVSTGHIWQKILECWAIIYSGLPSKILADQGSAFGSKFNHLVKLADVEVSRTGIEAYSSLGTGERYNEPIRTIIRKIMAVNPKTNKNLTLACAIKSLNDTLGPKALVPSALVFGEFPQVSTPLESRPDRPTHQERAEIDTIARPEIAKYMASLRLRRALKDAVPTACDPTFQPGDKVLVWRETFVANRIVDWLRSFTVDAFDPERKLVFVREFWNWPLKAIQLCTRQPLY